MTAIGPLPSRRGVKLMRTLLESTAEWPLGPGQGMRGTALRRLPLMLPRLALNTSVVARPSGRTALFGSLPGSHFLIVSLGQNTRVWRPSLDFGHCQVAFRRFFAFLPFILG